MHRCCQFHEKQLREVSFACYINAFVTYVLVVAFLKACLLFRSPSFSPKKAYVLFLFQKCLYRIESKSICLNFNDISGEILISL